MTSGSLVLFALATSCGAPRSTSAPPASGSGAWPPTCFHPEGTIAAYVPPEVPGVTFSAPLMCAGGNAYIRIARATGSRTLGTKEGAGGGFSEGCTKLPVDPADPTQCPVINAIAILAAAPALAPTTSSFGGVGLGPCGNSGGDYTAWNMSVSVTDWKDAAEMARAVATLLDRYDLVGFAGVGVRNMSCGTAL